MGLSEIFSIIAILISLGAITTTVLGWRKSHKSGLEHQREAQRLQIKERARQELVEVLDKYLYQLSEAKRKLGLYKNVREVFLEDLRDGASIIFNRTRDLEKIQDYGVIFPEENNVVGQLLMANRRLELFFIELTFLGPNEVYLRKITNEEFEQGIEAVEQISRIASDLRWGIQNFTLGGLFEVKMPKWHFEEEPRLIFKEQGWLLEGSIKKPPNLSIHRNIRLSEMEETNK